MGKKLTVIPTIVPATNRSGVPTPLYVTQNGRGVLLRFKTQEEADVAWRMLSAMAEAHADRTHATQLVCEHDYEAEDDKGWRCKKCGHMT